MTLQVNAVSPPFAFEGLRQRSRRSLRFSKGPPYLSVIHSPPSSPAVMDRQEVGSGNKREEISPFRFYSFIGIKTTVDMTERVEKTERIERTPLLSTIIPTEVMGPPVMKQDISKEEMPPFRFYSLVGIKTTVGMTVRVECAGKVAVHHSSLPPTVIQLGI